MAIHKHLTMVEAAENTGGTVCRDEHEEVHVCYLGPGHERTPRQPEHECSCGERWSAAEARP